MFSSFIQSVTSSFASFAQTVRQQAQAHPVAFRVAAVATAALAATWAIQQFYRLQQQTTPTVEPHPFGAPHLHLKDLQMGGIYPDRVGLKFVDRTSLDLFRKQLWIYSYLVTQHASITPRTIQVASQDYRAECQKQCAACNQGLFLSVDLMQFPKAADGITDHKKLLTDFLSVYFGADWGQKTLTYGNPIAHPNSFLASHAKSSK